MEPEAFVCNDDLLKIYSDPKHLSHFSKWGPSRPQHTILYPRSKKKSSWRKYAIPCTCVFVSVSILALVGALIFLFYHTKSANSPQETSWVTYGPGDTETLFFSPLLSERLSPKTHTLYSSDFGESSLYLLDEEPSLTGKTNISFKENILLVDKIQQRNFHFYPNSTISFEVCAGNSTSSGLGCFYLVQGQKIYTEWVESGESSSYPPFVKWLQVKKSCDQGSQSFAYRVTEEDQYYLIFDGRAAPNSSIVVHYNLERTVYEVDPSTVKGSCNFTTSPCSVHVPFQPWAAALLVYGTPKNWEEGWENTPIGIYYAPRLWAYVVIGAGGLVAIAVATLGLCVVCFCCGRCLATEDDEAHKPLLNHHTASLFDRRPRSEELSHPSRDAFGPSQVSCSPSIFRQSPSPYPPPSFKDSSDKFSLGPPTSETFTGTSN